MDKGSRGNDACSNTFEAREWLMVHPDKFGADRFSGHESALDFVAKLYAAGAIRVDVVVRRDNDYASFMRVALPTDLNGRERLFAICNKEADLYGGNFGTERETMIVSREQAEAWGEPDMEGEIIEVTGSIRDRGQHIMTFWWD